MADNEPSYSVRTPNSANLLNLGNDVWLEILLYFDDPRDALCLRMVCKYLSSVTKDRTLWKRLLETLCIRDHAPLCTFQFSDMDQEQLERAVLRPYLFMELLSSPGVRCMRETVLRFPSPSSSPQVESILQIMCVPGERFVLTRSTTGWIVAWDLGPAHKAPTGLGPKMLASRKLDDTPYPFVVVPTRDNMKLRLIADFEIAEGVVGRQYLEMIVDFGAGNATPSISVPRLLCEARSPPSFTPDGRFMAYEFGLTLTVRDLILDQWGVVELQCDILDSLPLEFVIDPTSTSLERGVPHVHVTAIVQSDLVSHLQLYRVHMFSTLASAQASCTVQPLDARLLLFAVENIHFMESTSPFHHSGPPVVLYGETSQPQLYRLGVLQSPDIEEPSLRVLLPAERFGGTLLPLYRKVLFRMDRKWAAFEIDVGNSQLSVKAGRLVRQTDWYRADDDWRVVGVVPVGSSIRRNFFLNSWNGTVFITAASGQTHGEVRLYEFMD